MAVANGYGKVVTSGSAFMYDTGDTFNSYKGQPGTNITTGVNRNYNGYNKITYDNGMYFETNGYTEVVNIPALGPTTVQSIEIHNEYCGYGCNGNYQCCPNLFNYTGGWMSSIWLPGQTYSYQIIYKCASGYTHPNFMYHYEYTSGESYLTEYGVFDTNKIESLGDGWYHAWNTFTTNASAAKGYTGLWYYNYNISDKVSIAAVSITPGDTIRPPREIIPSGTTRSATQGLLPLVGDSSINLSTVSFNSNAQMYFDGTDDRIALADGTKWFSNDWTYEMVVKFNSNTGTYQGLLWGEGDTGGGSGLQMLLTLYNYTYFHYRINNSSTGWDYTNTSNITFTPTNYNHIIWQFNNGTTNIYVNGNLFHTDSSRGAYSGGTTSPLYIGSRNDAAYPFSGQMPVLKRYNRALTPSEVKQNYNKYKTRFNLP
jgi:hypothetical protein